MPILIVLVLLPMQFGLWWHGKQAAETAAEQGAAAAAVQGVDPGSAGAGGANYILANSGNLTGVNVSVSVSGETVTVTVSGKLSWAVLGQPRVTASATAPLERFVTETERLGAGP